MADEFLWQRIKFYKSLFRWIVSLDRRRLYKHLFERCFHLVKMLPYQCIFISHIFGRSLSLVHLRKSARSMSYYTLFQGWQLLGKPPDCLFTPTYGWFFFFPSLILRIKDSNSTSYCMYKCAITTRLFLKRMGKKKKKHLHSVLHASAAGCISFMV